MRINIIKYIFTSSYIALLYFLSPNFSYAHSDLFTEDPNCTFELNNIDKEIISQINITTQATKMLLSKIEDLKEKARRTAKNNPYLTKCLKKNKDKNLKKEQDYAFSLSCGPGYERTGWAQYDLEIKDDLMTVKLKGSYIKNRRDKSVLSKFLKSMECVQEKLSENGIYLDYDFIDADVNIRKKEPEDRFIMYIYDKEGMHDQFTWYTKGLGNRPISPKKLCSLTTHEILHHLGLLDLYENGNCGPKGPFYYGDKSNIMFRGRQSVDTAIISKGQINQIVKPICEPDKFPDEGYHGFKKIIFTPELYKYNDEGVIVPRNF